MILLYVPLYEICARKLIGGQRITIKEKFKQKTKNYREYDLMLHLKQQ